MMLGRKTLLINPPLINGVAFTRQGRCQERDDVLGTTKPPYTLALLASILRQEGVELRLVDATIERLSIDQVIARLDAEGFAPTLILFPSTTPTLDADVEAIARLKAHYGAPMFCFGPHASTVPAVSMERAPAVDGMFVGEPEDAVRQLARLDSISRLGEIASLTWRTPQGAVVPHRAHGSYDGFLTMPYPSWDLVPIREYALPLVDKPYVIVETSRGCPYSCDFCVAPIHQGHKFRQRGAKDLVDEIERTYRERGIEYFYLWGDTVTLNVKAFTAFCDELIARNLPIHWFGNARADNLTDPAFVHRLKRAGCWMLALGIETESEDVRKDMVKRLERQKIEAAFRNMRQAGIKSFAFFIFGYPGETLDTIDQTVNYAIELDPDFANFYPAVPYPGTELFDKVVKEGLLPPGAENEWARMEYSYYLLSGNGLNEKVVMDAIHRAKRRFFLRPGYIARHLGDVARLAFSKRAIFLQVASRTLFGGRTIDTASGAFRGSATLAGADRR
ncbi:MAG TPA: radical SAM protein [Vicinamibacterales bacterium]|nr:radical SAM protein [Vicinamibacterales bacterium]